MKRLEAIISTEKVSAVNDALKKAGVMGVTVINGKGRGAGHREELGGGRGTSHYIPDFHSRSSIITVVDDSKVDTVVNAIISAVSTGTPGDGKIFITDVEDVVDVGSKKKGKEAL
jgi:nitrogen regulatory protein P-II 1